MKRYLIALGFLGLVASSALAADTIPPSVPSGLTAINIKDNSFSIKWTPSTDAVGVAYYHVDIATASTFYSAQYVAGWNNKWTTATQITIPTLAPNTTYYARVWATDAAGNASAKSSVVSVKTLPPPPTGVFFIQDVEYNAIGQAIQITYGNGDVTTNTYDPLNMRLTRILTISGAGVRIQDLAYLYDSKGNITKISDNLNATTQRFVYDELDRLVSANGTRYGQKTYQYDQIGNIIQKDGRVFFYGEGAAGEHAVTHLSDGSSYTYDLNGNMVSQQQAGSAVRTYGYDSEQRLVESKTGSATTATYEYDDQGQRTRKTVGSTISVYIGELYEETAGQKIKVVFLNGQKAVSIVDGQILYNHTDHLGSANVVTNQDAQVREITEYDPFGAIVRQDRYGEPEEVARWYFAGHYLDQETNLIYMGARYYSPTLGRFLTPDITTQDPSNPQTFNRYTYANNNPVNNVDPDGHGFWKSVKSWFKATVQIAFAIVATMAGMPWLIPIFNAGWTALQGGTAGQIAASFAIGAVAGWAGGAGAGKLGSFFEMSKSGVSLAMVRGGLTGLIAGAGDAAVSGGNIGKGALYGAALGGGMGATFWKINDGRTQAFLKRVKFENAITPVEQGKLIEGIREFGQSPVGGRIMDRFLNQDDDWIIGRNNFGGPAHTEGNRTGIYSLSEYMWNSGPASDHAKGVGWGVRMAHELGHTDAVFGLTPIGQCAPVPLNVAYAENPLRAWLGMHRADTRGGVTVPRTWMFQY